MRTIPLPMQGLQGIKIQQCSDLSFSFRVIWQILAKNFEVSLHKEATFS